MATTLYFRGASTSWGTPGVHRGTNSTRLTGAAVGWNVRLLATTRGNSADATPTLLTVEGPTAGIEIAPNTTTLEPYEWISMPVDQAVTISGTITLNLWGNEGSMSANAAINAIIERLDSTGTIVSTIAQTARTTELPVTTSTAQNFTVTPTSTAMEKGDRIRVRVYVDDASTTMDGPYACVFNVNGGTAGAIGDSYITFTETFGFLTTQPSGSILYLTTTAGPAVGSADEREMWTSRGATATTAVVTPVDGFAAPVQWTATAGGAAIEWYSKPLAAFTLDGLVRVNLRANLVGVASSTSLRAELAICDGNGSNAVVWAAYGIIDSGAPGSAVTAGTSASGALTTTQAAVSGWLAGASTSVAAGKRLRLRVFVDDSSGFAMAAIPNVNLVYNGPTANASGDSWIQLPQTVSEGAGAADWPGVIASTWSAWTATAVGEPSKTGVITSTWSAWTATAAAQPIEHPGVVASTWSTTFVAVATRATAGTVSSTWTTGFVAAATVNRAATVASVWSAWTATAAGGASKTGVIASTWSAWTATGIATRATFGTVASTWSATFVAVGVRATAATVASTWSATFTASGAVGRAGVVASTWSSGTWTAVGTASTPSGEVFGNIASTWSAWTATGSAIVSHPATVSGQWASITFTANALINNPGDITTVWSAWTATAAASVGRFGTIAQTWSAWTATAVGVVRRSAAIASTWGPWTATAAATRTHFASSATTWGPWTATGIGSTEGEAVGTISSTWGPVTFSGAASRSINATVGQTWGPASFTALGAISRAASVDTTWTTTFVGAATVNHPAVSATTWTTEFVAAAGRETFGAVSTTWGPVGFYALGLSTLPIETEGFVFAWRVDPVLTAVRLDEASVTWRVDPVLTAVETSGV